MSAMYSPVNTAKDSQQVIDDANVPVDLSNNIGKI